MADLPGPDPDATNQAVLETPRLTLSFGSDEDARELFPFVHGEAGRAVTDFLLWDGPDELEEMASYFRRHTTGTFVPHGFHWLPRDRSGEISGHPGKALGSIGINSRGSYGRCSVGYWLAPPYWHQGVMKEALQAVLKHGFETLGVVKFEADVFVHNLASAALLESLNFAHEGTVRKAVLKQGQWVDEHLYGLLPEDLHDVV
ncbi:MAG TPA: GNAT family protein [Acidimicrobiia bacterium]